MNVIKRKIIREFLEYCANRDSEVSLREWDEYGRSAGGDWDWVDDSVLIDEFFKELEGKDEYY